LDISVKITQELERIASYTVTSLDKIKQDNEVLLKQGLDLNAVMAEQGLDFDLMEQLEIEHRGHIEKVRNATFKPNSRKYVKGSRVLTPERNVGDGKWLLE